MTALVGERQKRFAQLSSLSVLNLFYGNPDKIMHERFHLGATHTIAPKSNLTVLKTSFKTLCKSFASFTFQVIDH